VGSREPDPRKVVTLCASNDKESDHFETLSLPSRARLLLADVVNLAYEEMSVPLIETESDLEEELVFTTTMITSVSPRVHTRQPDCAP
jgi:hypothetical protein